MQVSDREKRLTILPRYVRVLCIITLLLLSGSTFFELWIMISPWFKGVAFHAIFEGYQRDIPELQDYKISLSLPVYYITLILDLLGFVPYYIALLLSSFLFYRFYCGAIWERKNIKMLKVISALIIVNAVFPAIAVPLQILTFSSSGKWLLQISLGFQSEAVRSCIVGFSLYVFSVVIDKAKNLNDEINLII